MSSLRKEEKRVAKRRQVYKPLLDNPFTNEGKLWPHVSDQKLVLELFEEKVLKRWKRMQEVHKTAADRTEAPKSVVIGFNSVVSYLSRKESLNVGKHVMLFVCNRDLPAILVSQIPLLCETASHTVLLVQLPKGSIRKFEETFENEEHDGLCLVETQPDYEDLLRTIETMVEPLSIPWLHTAQFQKAPVKVLVTSAPIMQKKQNKNCRNCANE